MRTGRLLISIGIAAVLAACASSGDESTTSTTPGDGPAATAIVVNELAAQGKPASTVPDAIFALEPDVQASLSAAIAEYAPDKPFTLSGLTVNATSGAIAAVASSQGDPYEFIDQQRSSASTLKMVVLAAALGAGAQPDDRIVAGLNCVFPDGLTSRIDESLGVAPTLSTATHVSSNCSFVKLTRIVGEERLEQTLETLGIGRPFDLGSRFAIGANTVSARELTQMLATIINARLTPVHLVVGTRDDNGQPELFKTPPRPPIDPETAAGTLEALEGVLTQGTAAGAEIPGHASAGKTGTSANSSNAWFVGGTTQYVTVMWAGHPTDLNAGLNGAVSSVDGVVSGGNYTAQAWQAAMQAIHDPLPAIAFNTVDWNRKPVILVDSDVDCISQQPGKASVADADLELTHVPITPNGIRC